MNSNQNIADAIYEFYKAKNEDEYEEGFVGVLNALAEQMSEKAMVPSPFLDVVREDGGHTLVIDVMNDDKGQMWLPVFTDDQELCKGKTANVHMEYPLENIVRAALARGDVAGLVINPFGQAFSLPKDFVETFLEDYDRWIASEQGDEN